MRCLALASWPSSTEAQAAWQRAGPQRAGLAGRARRQRTAGPAGLGTSTKLLLIVSLTLASSLMATSPHGRIVEHPARATIANVIKDNLIAFILYSLKTKTSNWNYNSSNSAFGIYYS